MAMLVLHFTMLLIYAQPFKPLNNKFMYLSQAYAYPYFHQNWNLFAPVPNANYKLFVKDNAGQTKDIFNTLLLKHQSNRLAGCGPLLLAFSNSIHYFEKNTALQKKLNGPVRNDFYFTMLEHEVNNYNAHIKKTKVQPLKLILVVEDIPAKTQRVYFNQ